MSLSYKFLHDQPNETRTVINWWNTVWSDRLGSDLDGAEQQLAQSLSKTELPIHLLAYFDDVPVGTAALKHQEMETLYPDCYYWLGSVFVDPRYRGSKVASDLTMQIVSLAKSRALPHLYLQTADLSGGLYASLGWKPVERFSYNGEETLLMLNSFE
jgi:GNAT superfamily N-acetyltransferase